MSDDLHPEEPWFNNRGVSLPGGKNATYNMYLSPLFTNRNGTYGGSGVIWSHGAAGRLWASNAMGGSRANFLDATSDDIAPNHVYWRNEAYSLRCLVSTNNKIIIKTFIVIFESKNQLNLVSNNDRNGAWTANDGITLPDDNTAAYNAGLSPLFISRSGGNSYERVLSARGRTTSIIASNLGSKGSRYTLEVHTRTIYPSRNDGGASSYASALRCLVSTNNR